MIPSIEFPVLIRTGIRTNEANLTETVKAGKLLWEENNCMGCHTLLGEGGYYAPDLTNVVKKRGDAWIRVFLDDPETMFPGERRMVKYNFSDTEKSDLINFLAWVGEIDTNGWPPEPNIPKASLGISGKEINKPVGNTVNPPQPEKFKQLCLACHIHTARATHTNLLVVWLLTGFMGSAYYNIPEESDREIYSVKLAYIQLVSWVIVGVVAIAGFHFGWWEGRKFLEIPRPLDYLVVVNILLFLGMAVWALNMYKRKGKDHPNKIALYWTLGCAIMSFIGAGFLGFAHTWPQVNQWTHGTLITAMHRHLAFWGAYAMLVLAIIMYAMPNLTGRKIYNNMSGYLAFWMANVGMVGMTGALAVAGITQVYLERKLGMDFLTVQKEITFHFIGMLLAASLFTLGILYFIFDFIRFGRPNDEALNRVGIILPLTDDPEIVSVFQDSFNLFI
jgi:nitric oxide reductase large subunit